MKHWLVALWILALPGLANAAPLKVATSFSIIEDLVKNVGGARVATFSIVPANADAHEYQASSADARKLAGAKLFFVNGLGFESWLERLIGNAAGNAKPVVISKGIKPRTLQESGKTIEDPHQWWDLANTQRAINTIRDALSATDPTGRKLYVSNAAKYNTALSRLDAEAKNQIARLAKANRKLVTDHDALGYFADRYGFELIGTIIPSGTTSGETSAKDLARLSQAIKRAKVKAIFPNQTIGAKLAQALANETGVRVAPALYTDALGAKGSNGATFLQAFKHNLAVIVQALR